MNLLVAGYRRHDVTKTLSGGAVRAAELVEVIKRYKGKGSWQYMVLRFFHICLQKNEKLPVAK